MKPFTNRDLLPIVEAYGRMNGAINEATARPTSYKMLTPEQAETVAKLSPSYKSKSIWGSTSNWLCSMVNRMMKFGKKTFDEAFEAAKGAADDVKSFETYGKKLGIDISSIKSFEDLHKLIDEKRDSGELGGGLSQQAKSDGRARQCYSLIKNGAKSGDMVQTYEDGRYLIGYPTNLEYNRKFSSIGKWCHTGSFDGGSGQQYWDQYAVRPIFYILDKESGEVLCASWSGNPNSGEVRNQMDNYPSDYDGWDDFFYGLKLGRPMVLDIEDTVNSYNVPDDVGDSGKDVWDRVDYERVVDTLFNGNSSDVQLEDSGYGDGGGEFYFIDREDLLSVDPNVDETTPGRLKTHYDPNPGKEYFKFDEFKKVVSLYNSNEYGFTGYNTSARIPKFIIDEVLEDDVFRYIWENKTVMRTVSYGKEIIIDDNLTMADRMSIDDFRRLLNGEDVDLGTYSARRCKDIRKAFSDYFCGRMKGAYTRNINEMFESSYGYISFDYDDRRKKTELRISIDADEAEALGIDIANGRMGDADKIDILSLNLGGKNTFAMKRFKLTDLCNFDHFVSYVKYMCRKPVDVDGQMTFELRDKDGHYI